MIIFIVPVETWLKTAEDKTGWTAYASSTKEGGTFMPSFAIDGTHGNIATNLFMSDSLDTFPWLQVRNLTFDVDNR